MPRTHCKYCGTVVKPLDELVFHEAECRDGPAATRHACRYCEEEFGSLHRLQRHEQQHEATRSQMGLEPDTLH